MSKTVSTIKESIERNIFVFTLYIVSRGYMEIMYDRYKGILDCLRSIKGSKQQGKHKGPIKKLDLITQ